MLFQQNIFFCVQIIASLAHNNHMSQVDCHSHVWFQGRLNVWILFEQIRSLKTWVMDEKWKNFKTAILRYEYSWLAFECMLFEIGIIREFATSSIRIPLSLLFTLLMWLIFYIRFHSPILHIIWAILITKWLKQTVNMIKGLRQEAAIYVKER